MSPDNRSNITSNKIFVQFGIGSIFSRTMLHFESLTCSSPTSVEMGGYGGYDPSAGEPGLTPNAPASNPYRATKQISQMSWVLRVGFQGIVIWRNLGTQLVLHRRFLKLGDHEMENSRKKKTFFLSRFEFFSDFILIGFKRKFRTFYYFYIPRTSSNSLWARRYSP